MPKKNAAVHGEAHLQFTIEARELRNPRSLQTTIDALDAQEAIRSYVQENGSQLMSVSRPSDGRESIAMVRKDDSVYLVRVYAA
jgi:hypothetical protein